MPLPEHVQFRVELSEILANATALHIRIRECETHQRTHEALAEYPIPDDINIEYAEKKQHWEGELQSILEHVACKYQETSLSTLECFYIPGDAEDVEKYGQELIEWTSDIRKHLIQLKAEAARMLRDGENGSGLSKDSLLPDFQSYEKRLKAVYHSVIKFELWLKFKSKPELLANPRHVWPVPLLSPPPVLPDSGNLSRLKPNNDVTLTERLDKIRNTLTEFHSSRSEFSTRLFQVRQKYHLESFKSLSPLSSQSSITIHQTINNIMSEFMPRLLSAAKSACQEALNYNEQTFHLLLAQQLQDSLGIINVAGVTTAALISVPEDGEILE